MAVALKCDNDRLGVLWWRRSLPNRTGSANVGQEAHPRARMSNRHAETIQVKEQRRPVNQIKV